MTATARLDVATVREAARGRWRSLILPALDITVPDNTRRHAPCPVCGGKDRFRFDDQDGRGTYYCNQCDPHAGDGFDLVRKARHLPFRETLPLVAGVLGLTATACQSTRRPVPPPIVRIDRKARAFQFELAGLDLRLRAEKILEAGTNLDVASLSDDELDRALALTAQAHADIERAQLFEHTADGLLAGTTLR